MQRAVIASLVALLAGPVYGQTTTAKPNQEPSSDAVFRGGVDLVTVSATVRDRRGRAVADLTAEDFEVLDRGVRRPITDFRTESAPVSVAILFDVSGSMDVASRSLAAKFAANHVLSWLEHGRDEAALFAFDSRLHEVAPFTVDTRALQGALGEVDPFGATSLHDAIADTAKRISERANKRRAIVVLTDGIDTASRLTPAEVWQRFSAIPFDGHGTCFLETGGGKSGLASGNFFASPLPCVRMRRPSRAWHAGKVAFEQYWLRRWL